MSTFFYLNNNLVNCTCNYNSKDNIPKQDEKYGWNIPIIFTANDGYQFEESLVKDIIIYPTYANYALKGQISKDKKRFIFDTENINTTDEGTSLYQLRNKIIATLPASKDAIFTYSSTLVHCSCNYTNGEKISLDKDIIFTADEGYYFTKDYSMENKNTGLSDYWLTRSSDNKKLVYHIEELNSFDLDYDNIEAIKIPETVSKITNIYKITNDELNDFGYNYFHYLSNEGGVSVNDLDTGLIHALYILPVKIPSDFLNEKSSIQLGLREMETKANVVNNYKFIVDLGDIKVDEHYKNVYDYMNVECKLHIPFFDVIRLPVEYVMNQTIHIKYLIELYSGTCYVDITSSFNNGNSVYNDSMKIIQDIPFVINKKNSLVKDINYRYFNDITKPFIEIVNNIPYCTKDNIFGKETQEVNNLLSKNGYIEVKEIELVSSATLEEQKQIESLLREGIYIK